MTLLERAQMYLNAMPGAQSGAGGHDATFRAAACLVHGFSLDRESALSLLQGWNAGCSPPWTLKELEHKIDSAAKAPSNKPAGYLIGEGNFEKGEVPAATKARQALPTGPKWPERDHAKILQLVDESLWTLSDIEQASPIAPAACDDPYALIDCLFQGIENPWLCFAREINGAATRRRATWQGHLERSRFMVPSPMRTKTGLTQEGKVSERCLDNVGPRHYLVVECDFTRKTDSVLFEKLDSDGLTVADLCATVLGTLTEYAPLAMAVFSGSKSLHGWFPVLDRSERQIERFMRHSVVFGGDRATLNACQLVRMPGGIRDNGAVQTVHYFNPEVCKLAAASRSNPVHSTN